MEIEADDPNTNQILNFSIIGGNEANYFSLNPSTGELSLIDSDIFNEQLYQSVILEIEVTDNGIPQYSDQAQVIINVHEYENSIYIDPENESEFSDGSLQYPYESWNDFTWNTGIHYLQKRNTVAIEGSIVINDNSIYIGAYGYGEKPIIISQSNEYALLCNEKKNISINNIQIVADEAISTLYFTGSGNDSIIINKCNIRGGDYGIRIIGGINYTVCYNEISGDFYGLYSLANSSLIYYNIFYDNSIGIEITEYSSNVRVYNNVFSENNQSIFSTNSGLILYNNIFDLDFPGSVALVQQDDNYISDNNLFYPVSSGFIEVSGQSYANLEEYSSVTHKDLNSLAEDPLFVDKESGNYRVESNSPAINSGIDIGLSFDIYGNEVPIGNYPDIGIAESAAGNNLYSDPITRDKLTVNVYPNPSKGYIWITFAESANQEAKLRILDSMGKTIYLDDIMLDNRKKIDLSSFPSGIYTIQVVTLSTSVSEKLSIYR